MTALDAPANLRRYTDLPGLLHFLSRKQITLLDPRTWDDTNDSYYLLKYKEKKGLKSVLALCLTEAEETYHHWRVFSHGSSGVCIHLDRSILSEIFVRKRGFRFGAVEYRRVRDAKKIASPPTIDELPFLKRAGYSPEEEVRVIYESREKELPYLDVAIELSYIEKITLGPWINARLSDTVKKVVRSLPGCAQLDIRRSTLVGSTAWKRLGDGAT